MCLPLLPFKTAESGESREPKARGQPSIYVKSAEGQTEKGREDEEADTGTDTEGASPSCGGA
jgi:hypothetical protein